jgi:hypothetical protein
MKFRTIFFALLALIFAHAAIFAQVSNTQNQACNADFARLLVEQQVNDAKTIEETDKRIKILLRAADFLWKFEEETARKYFAEAFQVAVERFKEKGFESKNLGKGGFTLLPDLRMEVVRAIARKDGEWAKRLSEQLLQEFEKSVEERKNPFDKTREIQTLLEIARENAKTNPNLSQYLFARVMRYPLDFHWYAALFSVAAENKSMADALYVQLLQNYQNETPRRMLFLSAYPFAAQRIFGVDKYQYGSMPPDALQPNPNLQRQFLQTFFRRIGTFTANSDNLNAPTESYQLPESAIMVSALQEIEPIVVQNFPNLIESLALAKSQASSVLNEDAAKSLESKQKTYQNFNVGFDEKLKLLEEANAVGKLLDQQIVNLVFNAKKEEEFKKLESWVEKIKEEKTREQTTAYYYFKRSETARKDRRFDDAKRFALKVPEIEFRATLFFELASEQLKNVTDAASVLETLSDVSKMARSSDDSSAKAQVLLGLAFRYEKANHTIALTELGEAIRVINSLENPDIFADYMTRQISGTGFIFLASFSTTGFNMEKTFEEISKKDFELSLANARNLNDKYFRTIAVLAVAKNCIQNSKKEKVKGKS